MRAEIKYCKYPDAKTQSFDHKCESGSAFFYREVCSIRIIVKFEK